MLTSFWNSSDELAEDESPDETSARSPCSVRAVVRRLCSPRSRSASAGSMISAPIAPLLACSMRSEDIRLVAPNSIGVAVTVPVGVDRSTSPAYHW